MRELINWALNIGTNYPDLVAILVGTCAGVIMGVPLETWFIPETWPRRKQQGVTFLLTIGMSWVFSVAGWSQIDPKDPLRVDIVWSFLAAPIAWWLYPKVGAWITKRLPAVGSAFAAPPPDSSGS